MIDAWTGWQSSFETRGLSEYSARCSSGRFAQSDPRRNGGWLTTASKLQHAGKLQVGLRGCQMKCASAGARTGMMQPQHMQCFIRRLDGHGAPDSGTRPTATDCVHAARLRMASISQRPSWLFAPYSKMLSRAHERVWPSGGSRWLGWRPAAPGDYYGSVNVSRETG
jgi:hypothetical protein